MKLEVKLEKLGKSDGTTTGRPRRIGWFDTVVIRHARRVSGLTDLTVNSIDVLSGLEKVKICTAYKYQGELITEYPANLRILGECEPVYEELAGWSEDITKCKSLDDLPENARHYLERISQLTGVPISIFSVGPDRTQTNIVSSVWR